jgi:eukaryotic-like serine/threonine-protein kinase
MEFSDRTRRMRFGTFDVDLRSGEVLKHGIRLRVQGQPFQVLALLLEHAGDVVTREEFRQKLWPGDTFVDFDTGLNSAVKKLREALCDSAEEPKYIETLPRRGYRFVAHVENGASPSVAAAPVPEESISVAQPRAAVPALPTSSKRKWRVLIAAAVLALILVAAFIAWRFYFARPVLTEADVILVASFVNKTGDPIFDSSLDKALEVKLAESPFLSLLSEANVRESLRMMRHDPNERVTPELGIEICKRQGLKALVVPEIAAVGNTYLITLEAIDARSQKPIARQQQVAQNKDKVVATLGKAGSQLRRQLGESLSSLEKYNAPLDLATTSSLDALLAYRAGQNLYRSGKQGESIPFFERAVDLDPQFCSAYNMLGSAYHGTGDEPASRKNFAKAFELKDSHLTQEENFQTTALYDSAITGNLEKETTVLLLYKEAYPRSVVAYNLLGIDYLRQGRTEEALQNFNWAIAHSPVPYASHYTNASQALMTLGRFDEAKRVLDAWSQIGSPSPLQTETRYRIAFIEKDAATMDRLARESSGEDGLAGLQMNFAFLRGDVAKLRSLYDTAIGLDRKHNQLESAAGGLSGEAAEEAQLGNYHLARKLCAQALEAGINSENLLTNCAITFGEIGDTSAAEAVAEKLNELFPEDDETQKQNLPMIRSVIQRARGNPRGAVDSLSPITQLPSVSVFYYRARAYMAAGDQAKAIADFQTAIDHRGWLGWERYAPLLQLGLARAYAMQGDRDKSRKAYDDFFTTWKNADPSIPILRQAKAEYSKLAPAAAPPASASVAKN